tara:strand:- start:50 stop:502 length:453 start_codon:yes stop_codon:yes gene_type:complete
MELSDKIKLILDALDLTPSIFADEIGVQRSSISHILAGRNKPSLDVVQKIIKRFPELGINWILDDQILPNNVSTATISKSDIYDKKAPEIKPVTASEKLPEPTSPRKELKEPIVEAPKPIKATEKKAIKIMVLYSDGTFQEFNPSNSPIF